MSYSCKTRFSKGINRWICNTHVHIADCEDYYIEGLLEYIKELEVPIRVVVEIEGGVVTEVRATRPEDVAVIVLDHDTEEKRFLAVEPLGVITDGDGSIVSTKENGVNPYLLSGDELVRAEVRAQHGWL